MRCAAREWVRVAVCAVVIWGASTVQVGAWGYEVHRFVTDRAIALLPPELKPFFEKYRVTITEHSLDPDLWRSAGFADEPPRHFVDLDGLGTYPFKDLPRDYDAAVAKFGRARVIENGTLPWRVAEMYDKLVKSFSEAATGASPYAFDDSKFFAAVLAHYVADAHQPFHAALNYDGQLTDQHGIHARFETELHARYRGQVRVAAQRVPSVDRPIDFIFETLTQSFTKVDAVLVADREALGAGRVYDDAYFDRFFTRTRSVLESQVAASVAGIAAVWVGAWEAAGKPSVPLTPKRTTRTKRPAGAKS